jgi:hypothetical protein
VLGTYIASVGTNQTAEVYTTNTLSCPVTITVFTPTTYVACQMTSGGVTFTGLDLSTSPPINIDLGAEGDQCL